MDITRVRYHDIFWMRRKISEKINIKNEAKKLWQTKELKTNKNK